MDTDADSIPDVADPFPTDANNDNVALTYYWPGGYFTISNSSVCLPGGTYSGSWSDADQDGIPDPADPFPSDFTNGCYTEQFYWQGGYFTIDSVQAWFPAQTYSGTWNDADSDGIPDVADPYPQNASNNNNSFYWSGGPFRINDSDVFFADTYTGFYQDADSDGIPDAADPYPYDPLNNNTPAPNSFHWDGGSFLVNNSSTLFPPADYPGAWQDADSDGIPDAADPYPSDRANGNIFYWSGGTFRIADQDVTFAPGDYPGTGTDADNDGIPDSSDPYPTDAGNGNVLVYWGGGDFVVNNQTLHFDACYLQPPVPDTDSDGIPNEVDPCPYDPANGNTPVFYWNGGSFNISDVYTSFVPGFYPGTGMDTDSDGIPDVVDAFPGDPNNNDTSNTGGGDPGNTGGGGTGTFHWQGGSTYVNGVLAAWSEGDYPGTYTDSDGDGIPDSLDMYSGDPANNSASWPGGTFTINGVPTWIQDGWHSASSGDADGDGIPDDFDPYPSDATNHSGLTWPSSPISILLSNGTQVDFSPQYYDISWADTDSDGIPDIADPEPSTYNSPPGPGEPPPPPPPPPPPTEVPCACGHDGCGCGNIATGTDCMCSQPPPPPPEETCEDPNNPGY